jgi:hypothetical protein
MMTKQNDIFRLVNLRGPQSDLSLDPETDPDVVEVGGPVIEFIHDPNHNNDLSNVSDAMAPILEAVQPSPLADLTALVLRDSNIPVTIRYGDDDIALKELAQLPRFQKDYANLYNAWLLARLQRRVAADYKAFEDQLRVGLWIYAEGNNPNTPIVPFKKSPYFNRPIALPQALRQKFTDDKQNQQTETLKKKYAIEKTLPIAANPTQDAIAAEEKVRRLNTLEDRFQDTLDERINAIIPPPSKNVMIMGKPRLGLFRRIETFLFGEKPLQMGLSPTQTKLPQVDAAFVAAMRTKLDATEAVLFDNLMARMGTETAPERFMAELSDEMESAVTESNRKLALLLDSNLPTYYDASWGHALPVPSLLDPIIENGAVQALGWGDLIVAKERLVNYEAREIAHIENVLPNELKSREHIRSTITEDTFETETVEREESERELETTSRHELQIESEKTVNTQFSTEAGVNVSGRYGLTKVESSLDVNFSRSEQESNRTTTNLAKDIVSKAVESTFKSVRGLRRQRIVNELRETNTHGITNTAEATGSPPTSISGIYRWVEKIHEIQLRHYGTRLMIEFHIPEPGLSIVNGSSEAGAEIPKPNKPKINASGITESNYLALAKKYNATNIEPPPQKFVTATHVWSSQPDENADDDTAEEALSGLINIPDKHRPVYGWYMISALPYNIETFNVRIQIDNQQFSHTDQEPIKHLFIINRFQKEHRWETGVGFSLTAHGHYDKTLALNIVIVCRRLDNAYIEWQIKTFAAIWAGYEALLREYEKAFESARIEQGILGIPQGAPAMVNRRTEREELQKWAVTIMRREPLAFNAVVKRKADGVEHDEVDPGKADQQAATVRFYEEAFEWVHMSYFFYPYFWGRRDSWNIRQSIRHNDYRFETFLRAGSARIIVPVTPRYEQQVLYYLANPQLPEKERIEGLKDEDTNSTPVSIEESVYDTLWLELLVNKNEELALGSGFLKVTQGSPDVEIVDSIWETTDRDLGRELYIDGEQYEISEIFIENRKLFRLTVGYLGESQDEAPYATGSVAFGRPWLVNLPTNLVILNENINDIRLDENTN